MLVPPQSWASTAVAEGDVFVVGPLLIAKVLDQSFAAVAVVENTVAAVFVAAVI